MPRISIMTRIVLAYINIWIVENSSRDIGGRPLCLITGEMLASYL